jgi:hypothetical protein
VDGGHYREMAGKLRELARLARTPLMRWELADLARRYDLRGNHFDRRAGGGGQPFDRCAVTAQAFGCGNWRRTSAAGLSSRSPW